MDYIVNPEWLHKNRHNQDLVLLDASLESTVTGESSKLKGTIPGARFFDLKTQFSDPQSSFPNTVPTEGQFQEGCRELGINRHSSIVVFDRMGIFSSPRVWWLFKAMGHDDVRVLDGGIPAWIAAGYATESMKTQEFPRGDFQAHFNSEFVKTYEDVRDNVENESFTIVDARSGGRFMGTAPEPRAHLQSGHIPNSLNLPYQEVLKDGQFKTGTELRTLFGQEISNRENLVFSCGSGMTACIILLASRMAGFEGTTIYDGSWTEWAEMQGLTV